ncbi:TPA: hypothetical protein ACSP2D_004105 [Aeromonas veronii]
MYRSFFELNSNLLRFECVGIDNRVKNKGLPEHYNNFIRENIDNDCWLFFVHEDFKINSGLDYVYKLNPNYIYGSFGVRLENGVPVGYGKHICSNKDGSNAVPAGLNIDNPVQVESIDCQSVLVHTSLLKKYSDLSFDEELKFDLYAEDFCLKASLLNIPIYVFPLLFQHYSHGKITERYYKGLDYLKNKYPEQGIAGPCSFIGGKAEELSKKFTYNITANQV